MCGRAYILRGSNEQTLLLLLLFSSRIKSKPMLLHPENLKLEVKKCFCCRNIVRTTTWRLQMEIFSHCLYYFSSQFGVPFQFPVAAPGGCSSLCVWSNLTSVIHRCTRFLGVSFIFQSQPWRIVPLLPGKTNRYSLTTPWYVKYSNMEYVDRCGWRYSCDCSLSHFHEES